MMTTLQQYELAEQRAEQTAPKPKYTPAVAAVLGAIIPFAIIQFFLAAAGLPPERFWTPLFIVVVPISGLAWLHHWDVERRYRKELRYQLERIEREQERSGSTKKP